MQELERMISIYHTAFIVCLVLAIVFLIISIILFIKFDIRKIFDMRTGRGAKRTIQKMEEINARTGKLREDVVSNTPPGLTPEERITYPVTAPNAQVQGELKRQQAAEQADRQAAEQACRQAAEQANMRTVEQTIHTETEPVITRADDYSGSSETTVLYEEGKTTLLSEDNEHIEEQQEKIKLSGVFKIEKEIMWIHTEEVL